MSVAKTEQQLRDYYASWGKADPEAVVPFFCEDATFEDLAFDARFEGHDGIRAFVQLTYAGAPDFQVRPVHLVVGGVEDENAAAEWVMSGTHRGDLPGLPATNKRFEVRASSVIVFKEERIHSIVDYWNLDSFRRAVGLI